MLTLTANSIIAYTRAVISVLCVQNWSNKVTASLFFFCLIGYLSKVLKNYTEQACDGDFLSVRCPPRTTITVQSAFYGRKGASDPQQCPQTYQALLSSYNAQEDDRYCSVSTALQVNTSLIPNSISVTFLQFTVLPSVCHVPQTWISSWHSVLSSLYSSSTYTVPLWSWKSSWEKVSRKMVKLAKG